MKGDETMQLMTLLYWLPLGVFLLGLFVVGPLLRRVPKQRVIAAAIMPFSAAMGIVDMGVKAFIILVPKNILRLVLEPAQLVWAIPILYGAVGGALILASRRLVAILATMGPGFRASMGHPNERAAVTGVQVLGGLYVIMSVLIYCWGA